MTTETSSKIPDGIDKALDLAIKSILPNKEKEIDSDPPEVVINEHGEDDGVPFFCAMENSSVGSYLFSRKVSNMETEEAVAVIMKEMCKDNCKTKRLQKQAKQKPATTMKFILPSTMKQSNGFIYHDK